MKQEELENIIRRTLKKSDTPDRSSFAQLLSDLPETVTESPYMRYNIETTSSNIINSKFADIVSVWKSKYIVLVPSLIVLLVVGVFALSPQKPEYSPISKSINISAIQDLAEQNEAIEDPSVDNDEDQIFLNIYDTPAVDDLSNTKNEI